MAASNSSPMRPATTAATAMRSMMVTLLSKTSSSMASRPKEYPPISAAAM